MHKFKNLNYLPIIAFLTVLSASIFLRVYAIAERPLHNDEGVNYFFAKNILTNGVFNYSHKNYHGPSYFYLLTGSTYLFGVNEFSQRFASAIPSLILSVICFFNFVYLRTPARLFVSLLLGISTTFLYYSRYSIHETMLVLSCMLGIHYAFLTMIFKKGRYVIYFLLSVGLAISTKETFIIHIASLCFALALVFPIRRSFTLAHSLRVPLSWAIFLSLLLIFVLFSGFLKSAEGVRELFMGVPQWLGRGHSDVGHHKPYWYYLKIIKRVEPLCLLGLLPTIEMLWSIARNGLSHIFSVSKRYGIFSVEGFFSLVEFPSTCITSIPSRAAAMFSLYGLASFLAYSYVPYKTPWLIINITVPLLISFGIWLSLRIKHHIIQSVCMLLASISLGYYSLKYNYSSKSLGSLNEFVKSVGVTSDLNPLSYVHTQLGMVEVSDDIAKYIEKKRGVRILIAVTAYWPLPYYLRDYDSQLMYAQNADPVSYFKDYDIIIANKEMQRTAEGWTSRYVRLSDNQEAMVYFKNF